MKELSVLGLKDFGKRGLLIEYDAGYISPEENKEIISEMKNVDFSQDLILYAVLQKYNVPNKNGRIYPEALLKRENEKYQVIIKKGGALNELNHPTCQSGNAMVLTNNGWKYIKDISDSEEIYTLNENGEIEIKRIYEKMIHQYNGKMIHIRGRNIDDLVTPNHKYPIINKNNKKRSFITAQEILDSFQTDDYKLSNYYIPKRGVSKEISPEYFTIKGVSDGEFSLKSGETERITYKQNINILSDVFMAFMGIYLSEGCVIQSKIKKRKSVLETGEESFYESSDHEYNVSITQKSPNNIKLIDELMDLFPLKVKRYVKKNGTVSYNINDRRLYKYLLPLGKSHQKFIPNELKSMSSSSLEVLLKWFKLGDGRTIGEYHQSDVFSTSKKLIEDLQEILLRSGGNGNIRKEEKNIDRYIKDDNGIKRLIKGLNSKTMWFLNISKTNGIWLDKRFLNVFEEDYNDKVFSINVANHIYYTKTNEKCHWTGNSSLIDLDRVSHSILETWWDGNILMGKIKLFTSPGWKKMGIVSTRGDQAAMLLMNGATLGISSRGVGSLKNVKGENIVQDDFDLVCFDIVSSPSTPGAYIFSDPSERDQYSEEEEVRNPENFDKMKSLMGKLDNFLAK